MYAGSTLKALKYLDAWFGAHQKIDRVARKNLRELIPGLQFPRYGEIVKFEGIDGPDGIKRKSPGQDEPWHFYDPEDPDDVRLIDIMQRHMTELTKALKAKNRAKTAFEAAWLAHAIVDGLTPAHHYPYEEELIRLRGGEGMETRDTTMNKLFVPGKTFPKKVNNNWKMWGDKGLLATHLGFEWGVAITSVPLRLKASQADAGELERYKELGLSGYFKEVAAEISVLDLYQEYYKTGWTPKLSKLVGRELLPRITRTVTLAWYDAYNQAGARG